MGKPINVLHVVLDSRRSGIPALVYHLIRSDNPTRVVHSVLFAYDGIYAQELRELGVRVITMGPRRPLLWRLNRFLLNLVLLKQAKAHDVIHLHSGKLAGSALLVKALGGRAVLHLHELPGRVGKGLQRAMAQVDCVAFCSKTCEAYFSDVPARNKRLLVNAIDVASLPVVDSGGGKPKIIMAGSINRNKGQHFLLEAFTRLKHSDAELYFYGTVGLSAKSYVAGLKRFVQERGLLGRVFFPGPSHTLSAVFQGAAVVVHTSLNESFGMVLVEAMGHGLPVVASNLNGMKEVVRDGVTGFLVSPQDVERLADRIDQLLGDPGLRREMGKAGRALVEREYNIASRVAEFTALYEDVCRPSAVERSGVQ